MNNADKGRKAPPLGFVPLDLPDEILDDVNRALNWQSGTVLPDGRILGRVGAHSKKYKEPVRPPVTLIRRLNDVVPLQGQRVLEIGCLEGLHTVGLLTFTDDVTAIDVRPENVIKTLTRVSFYGAAARVFQANAEQLDQRFGIFDVVFHRGVLYHLSKPVEHLHRLRPLTGKYLYLDTHVADPREKLNSIRVGRRSYSVARRPEGGWADPFSGIDETAVWLTEESLGKALRSAGFKKVRVMHEGEERNGRRIGWLLQ